MAGQYRGFTIIELVSVIVVLGILAAVAFPKFQDLSTSAKNAAVAGAVAAFKSASVITLAKNSGSVPKFASVSAQIVPDAAFNYTGPCPTVTVVYVTDTARNSTFTMDTTLCNG